MSEQPQPADTGPTATAVEPPSAQPLGLTAAGERCVACGAPLSSDQRYCVNCGERRSAPRFPETRATDPAAETATTPGRPPRRQLASGGGTALIAGVGTLLLAMGVGVLIGRVDAPSARSAATPKTQVVYLGGSSPSTNTVASAATPRAAAANPRSAKTGAKARVSAKPPPPAVAAKASAAAGKVIGSGANLAPPTVKVGQSGQGKGYNKGHFSGTFFGQ